MADINHIVSLGIGSPAGIPEFLTLGLQIGAAVVAADYVLTGDANIRVTASGNTAIRQTATGDVEARNTTSGDVEL